MSTLVVGAGPIGTHIALHLAARGDDVTVATRSGGGPERDGVRRARLDATDERALTAALDGVATLHLCAHASAYRPDVWRRELPALERTVLTAAARAGTTVVFPESHYAFDPRETLSERSTLRPAHELGRIRAELMGARAASPTATVSVVASDYYGPGAGANAHAGDRMVRPAATGGVVRPIGVVDLPHAWTYLPDLAAAMVAAAALPTEPDRLLVAPVVHATQREMALAYARAAGRDDVRVRALPTAPLRAVALVSRDVRALLSSGVHLRTAQHVDDAAGRALLGLEATPLEQAAAATVRDIEPAPAG